MASIKEQLQEVRDAWADVEKAAERVDRAKSRAEGTQARRYDGAGGDGNSAHYHDGDALEEVYKAQEELAECICFWSDKLRPMQELNDRLPMGGGCWLVIKRRYLFPGLFTWDEVAEKLGFSKKYCMDLQKKAFKMLEAMQAQA